MKTIVAIIFTLAMLAVTLTSCGKDLYDPSNTDIRINFNFYVPENYEDYEETDFENAIKETMDFSKQQDICESVNPVYDTARIQLTKFFAERYGLDISEKINKLVTYEYYQCTNVSGYNLPNKNAIYLNTYFIDFFSDDDLTNTWVHEAIHYLGFGNTPENSQYNALYEAATAALTHEFKVWSNLKLLEPEDGYVLIRKFAAQLFLVNPQLVVNQINGTELIENAIENALSNATYPKLDTESFSITEYYSTSLNYLIGQDEDLDLNLEANLKLAFLAQEITTAYCRTFAPSKEQIKELRNYYYPPFFENCYLIYRRDTGYRVHH